jgi:putative ABC transport system permease protein
MLGVPPQIGRTFTSSDDQPGAARVLLLSHKLWKRQFAGDPNIIGRSVRVSANEYTIIGVMPHSSFWQTEAEM